jgi:hypothetical protein
MDTEPKPAAACECIVLINLIDVESRNTRAPVSTSCKGPIADSQFVAHVAASLRCTVYL